MMEPRGPVVKTSDFDSENPGSNPGAAATRCDQCAHWKKDSGNEEWEAKEAGFGECTGVRERWRIQDEASEGLARHVSSAGTWTDADGAAETKFIDVRTAALKEARAYVQDGSEYRAELFTAPDFFCALFRRIG